MVDPSPLSLQAMARGHLARVAFRKRIDQANAIRVLQRNGLAWMKLREWPWWKLLSRVRYIHFQCQPKTVKILRTDTKIRRSNGLTTDFIADILWSGDTFYQICRDLSTVPEGTNVYGTVVCGKLRCTSNSLIVASFISYAIIREAQMSLGIPEI